MKLSDFTDEKAIEVVAKLLIPMGNIAKNSANADAKGKNKIEFASQLLRNNAKDVMNMFAILHDVEPSEYHCNAATILMDTVEMLNDAPLMELFGLQSQTPASSGFASTNGEAQEGSKDS